MSQGEKNLCFSSDKGLLYHPDTETLLSLTSWNPTKSSVQEKARRFLADPECNILALIRQEKPLALVVYQTFYNCKIIEIKSISALPDNQRKGLGSRLIHQMNLLYPSFTLQAETDDDAVGFYSALGFQVSPLGEKYPGIFRYACTLFSPSTL